jgi:hypothetical protein
MRFFFLYRRQLYPIQCCTVVYHAYTYSPHVESKYKILLARAVGFQLGVGYAAFRILWKKLIHNPASEFQLDDKVYSLTPAVLLVSHLLLAT